MNKCSSPVRATQAFRLHFIYTVLGRHDISWLPGFKTRDKIQGVDVEPPHCFWCSSEITGFTTLASKEWALLLTYQVILCLEDGITP